MGGALYTPPPRRGSPNTEAAYQEMMAPFGVALDSVSMVWLLSNLRTSRLGHYRHGHFEDHRVHAVVRAFRDALSDVEDVITARDAGRWLPYPFLRPSEILQSISI